MKVVYIIGPYRAQTIRGIEKNIIRAAELAEKYWKKGFMAFCPHKNSGMFDGVVPDEVFLEGGLELLRRCDAAAVLSGWEDSEGSIAEINLAQEIGIPIYYEQEEKEEAA